MQPLKISLIVEKRVDKKLKKTTYEIFHIITAKDALGNEFYPKQSVGSTSVKQLEAEIEEYGYQIDYRKQVLAEIADLESRKALSTKAEKAIEKYIEYKKEEPEEK